MSRRVLSRSRGVWSRDIKMADATWRKNLVSAALGGAGLQKANHGYLVAQALHSSSKWTASLLT